MKKINLKIIYFTFIVLFSGFATAFYRSQEGIISLFFFTILMMLIYRIKIDIKLVKVIVIWLVYVALTTIRNRYFADFFAFRHIVFFLTAYTIIHLYKGKLFIMFEKWIYVLAIISLFFWIWQIIDFSSLNSFMQITDVGGLESSTKKSLHNLVYTRHFAYAETLIPRNCGFAWEPGPFSVFLSIAIFFNFLRTNYILKGNLTFIILLVALLSTQSTTGFLIFGVLILYLISTKKKIYKYIYFILIVLLFGFLFFRLEFMYNKIIELMESGQNVDIHLQRMRSLGYSSSVGRFGGLILAFEDFKNYPLLGIGGHSILSISYIMIFLFCILIKIYFQFNAAKV